MQRIVYLIFRWACALFLLLAGMMAMLLPWAPGVRGAIALFFAEGGWLLPLSGLLLFGGGVAAFVILIGAAKRRCYRIERPALAILVEEGAVGSYVTRYLEALFPSSEVPYRLIIDQQRIRISAELPPTPVEEQRVLAERIHRELAATLYSYIGYSHPLAFSAYFREGGFRGEEPALR